MSKDFNLNVRLDAVTHEAIAKACPKSYTLSEFTRQVIRAALVNLPEAQKQISHCSAALELSQEKVKRLESENRFLRLMLDTVRNEVGDAFPARVAEAIAAVYQAAGALVADETAKGN